MLFEDNRKAFIVTVRLPRNPDHDPHNKVTGVCPLSKDFGNTECTDVTGEHHSIALIGSKGWDLAKIKEFFTDKGYHVTRVEGND